MVKNMELLQDIDKILEKLNQIRNEKRISIEKISTDIKKDKSVTSRILNGKYNLDLLTYINICISMDVDPVFVLEQVLTPNTKRVPLTNDDINSFEEIIKKINNYVENK